MAEFMEKYSGWKKLWIKPKTKTNNNFLLILQMDIKSTDTYLPGGREQHGQH